MADVMRTDALRRFKTLARIDQRLILDALSDDERQRLLGLINRASRPPPKPRLSPWLAKHIERAMRGNTPSLTAASRELVKKTLANWGGEA